MDVMKEIQRCRKWLRILTLRKETIPTLSSQRSRWNREKLKELASAPFGGSRPPKW